jgi:hypothetical protein
MVVKQGLQWIGADKYIGTENTNEDDQIHDAAVVLVTNFVYSKFNTLDKTGYSYILKEF